VASYKREKNGTWTARLSARKLGTDGPDQPTCRGCRTKAEAQKWVAEREHARGQGTYVVPSKATVTELVEADLDTQVALGRMRTSTASGYRVLFGRNVAPTIGDLRAQDIDARRLNALYADLLTSGRREATERRGKGLAPATVRLVHSLLSGCFARAVKAGSLAQNPCSRATPPGASTAETPTWSLAELREFLAHPAVRQDPDVVLWRTAATTGMRRGELLGLQWDDIDLGAGVVHVRRNAVLVDGEVVVQAPKTRQSERRVKIGAETVAALRDHLARQRERRVAIGPGYRDGSLVFPRVDGTPRNPIHVSSAFHKLVARTGLRAVTLHSLRHAHASLLLDQGQKIHDVAARLGHTPAVLLRRYAHHDAASQDAAAALEELLEDRPALRVVKDEPLAEFL
jgi:integrase